jgi:MoxR-like ATPase
MRLIEWHIKSTTKASQGLYEYDAVSRLRDSQLGNEKVEDIANYIKKGKLWDAFTADEQVVLLVDEIDKADIEFPNDLLQELDRMEFYCYELDQPEREVLEKIISVHIPKIKKKLLKEAIDVFFDIRKVPGIKKKPSTSELIDWLKLIVSDDIAQEVIASKNKTLVPPLYGALLKNEQDVELLQRLAFMTRRDTN